LYPVSSNAWPRGSSDPAKRRSSLKLPRSTYCFDCYVSVVCVSNYVHGVHRVDASPLSTYTYVYRNSYLLHDVALELVVHLLGDQRVVLGGPLPLILVRLWVLCIYSAMLVDW
jgi:hypothetical protein